MRCVTVPLLALLLSSPALADTTEWIRSQCSLAWKQQSEGKPDEAIATVRVALAAARRARLHAEASGCLSLLGSMRRDAENAARAKGEQPAPLAKALYREAAREAALTGDVGGESRYLSSAAADDEESEDHALTTDRMDAATASVDVTALHYLAFSADVAPCLPILDLFAEAALAEARGDGDAAAKLLAAAADAATKAGFKRCAAAATARLARAGNDRGRADEALKHADAALVAGQTLGNLLMVAEARLERGRAFFAKGDAGGATKELRAALNGALDLYDADLEARALGALAAIAPAAEKGALLARAARAEDRRHEKVLAAAAHAARVCDNMDVAAEGLRAERVRRPAAAKEIDRLLAMLGQPTIPPRSEIAAAHRDRLKAILSSDNAVRILVGLEILRRHDAWPLIAEAGAKSQFPWVYANALETLATRDDFAALLTLVRSENALFAEAAAAAVLRLSTLADAPAVKKALDAKPPPNAALYLQAVVARAGDATALNALRAAVASEDNVTAHHAAVALGQLGFGSSYLRIADRSGELHPEHRGRILARSPATWGLVWPRPGDEGDGAIQIARANHVRRVKYRGMSIDRANNMWEIMYLLPATPEETRLCGNAWLLRTAGLVKDDLSGDILTWIAGGLGYDMYGGEERLKKRTERNEAAFALEDLEEHRLGAISGTQTRVLSVMTGSAWARIRCTATPEVGRIVDNTIQLPFEVVFDTKDGTGGGLLGALDKVTLQITISNLVPEATIRIPGYEPFLASVKGENENRLWVFANLPIEPGEGLDPGKVIPLEKIAQGTVTLSLAVESSRASMTFPLAVLVPPAKDKPDLVAVDLTVQPAVPKVGEEAELRLRTRNTGKSIDDAGLLMVRFEVLNPQDPGGKRTIDLRLTEAKGWRAGEWRYFEARPTAIRGWYMNAWSYTWTLEMGDTRLIGVVDAEGKLAEDSEDNNAVELGVPLRLDEEEAKLLAEEEILERMTALLRAIGEAKTVEQARGPGYEALGMLRHAKVSTPAIELAQRHLQAAVETQIHRVRVRDALERARTLARDPRVNQDALRKIMAELADAETDLMDTGVPVKEDTLTWWRNRVQVTANVVGAGNDYAKYAGVFGGPDDVMPESMESVGESLNKLDGALQCVRYVRDRADGGEYDNADAIEGTVKIFGGGGPGVSNLHQALLKAEIDYVDRGFRKEATALDALSALISGEPGAQERLDAAVRDVEVHVTAGPFNEAAQKEILQGWAKDIPVVGKLLDAWWSWK